MMRLSKGMTMRRLPHCVGVALVLLLAAQSAHAACYANGKWYKTGEQVNGLACQADGSWR